MGCGIITKRAEELGITPGVNVLDDVSINLSGAGIFTKMVPLRAEQRVIQHKHPYDHLSILLSGLVEVRTDDTVIMLNAIKAPQSIVIKAGIYHAVHAITDALWLCIHNQEFT